MTKVQDLTLWREAAAHLDQAQPEVALDNLIRISEQTSKIRFNVGIAYEKMALIDQAIQVYAETILKDEHFAVAYFQRGCMYFKQNRYAEALRDFEETQQRLRGRNCIDYGQLGMRYKLCACEILHNQGVCLLHQDDYIQGMEALLASKKVKVEGRHKAVEDTLARVNEDRQNCHNIDIITLPAEAFFRPSKDKLKNMNSVDYLGKAKVVTAVNGGDEKFSGFSGTQLLEVAKKTGLARSAPTSPILPRRGMAGSSEQQLVDHLHRALSPERDTRPRVLSGNKAKTPPAKWSPATLGQKPIPPPPNRAMPQLPQVASQKSRSLPTEMPRTDTDDKARTRQRPPMPLPEITLDQPGESEQPGLGSPLMYSEPVQRVRGQAQNGHGSPPESSTSSRHSPVSDPRHDAPPPLPQKNLNHKPISPNRSPKGNKRRDRAFPLPPERDLPPSPTDNSRRSSSGSELEPVNVKLVCRDQREITLPRRSPLKVVLSRAGELFDLTEGSFDIWKKNSKEEFILIEKEKNMQSTWKGLSSSSADTTLTLWVFGKQ